MGPENSKRYVEVVCYDMSLDNGGEEGGKPKVILSLRVVDGPDTGVNLTSYHYLTEAAAPYTMKALKALGWTGTKLSKAMADGLGSRKAQAQLKVETYEGKTREKVAGIFEIKARGPKNPVEASDLDNFDALFEDIAASSEGPSTPLTNANIAPPLPPAVKRNAVAQPTTEPDPF